MLSTRGVDVHSKIYKQYISRYIQSTMQTYRQWQCLLNTVLELVIEWGV